MDKREFNFDIVCFCIQLFYILSHHPLVFITIFTQVRIEKGDKQEKFTFLFTQ